MSQLVVRGGSVEEEYNQARYVLKKMSWYKKHGYYNPVISTPAVPAQPHWRALAEESLNKIDSDHIDLGADTQIEQPELTSQSTPEEQAIFRKIDSPEMRGLFEREEYSRDFFQPGLEALKKQQPLIEQALQQFSALHNKWGNSFKLFPRYELTLTRYGTGGSYDENIGQVIMKMRADGTLARANPYVTAIHEMVHIGIEDELVRKYKLSQDEKERLVDRICMTQFPDVIKEYRMRETGSPEEEAIDVYLTQLGAMDNLPETIDRYVRDHPKIKIAKEMATHGITGGTEAYEISKSPNIHQRRITGKLPSLPG